MIAAPATVPPGRSAPSLKVRRTLAPPCQTSRILNPPWALNACGNSADRSRSSSSTPSNGAFTDIASPSTGLLRFLIRSDTMFLELSEESSAMQRPARAQSELAETPALLRGDIDGVALLTLNRPETRNALSEAMLTALGEAFASIPDDKNVRAVVVAGNGPAFCAGHDLKEIT